MLPNLPVQIENNKNIFQFLVKFYILMKKSLKSDLKLAKLQWFTANKSLMIIDANLT